MANLNELAILIQHEHINVLIISIDVSLCQVKFAYMSCYFRVADEGIKLIFAIQCKL